MHSVALHTCVWESTTKICMKIDPYYQRQKCSPGILVSSRVSFIRIFAGVHWGGASNESGVVENGDFRFSRLLYQLNFIINRLEAQTRTKKKKGKKKSQKKQKNTHKYAQRVSHTYKSLRHFGNIGERQKRSQLTKA